MRWSRLVFGWQSSPYFALRMLARALEVAVETTGRNVFQIHRVLLNLPGQSDYDPSQPRLGKRRENGEVSADIIVYFDDARVFGPTEEAAQLGMRQVTARIQYLGNQDAARKRRAVSQRPGTWAGGMVYTDQGLMRKLISQAKWDKVKAFLAEVRKAFDEDSDIQRARFLSGTGFLLHVAQTYEFMQPYLKSFHLAIEAWRAGRGPDGWKELEWAAEAWDPDEEAERIHWGLEGVAAAASEEDRAPLWITKITLLETDVKILQQFFCHPNPAQVIFRPIQGAAYVAYGAGDASGEGFGANIHPIGRTPEVDSGRKFCAQCFPCRWDANDRDWCRWAIPRGEAYWCFGRYSTECRTVTSLTGTAVPSREVLAGGLARYRNAYCDAGELVSRSPASGVERAVRDVGLGSATGSGVGRTRRIGNRAAKAA
jgi:hypothetical protein